MIAESPTEPEVTSVSIGDIFAHPELDGVEIKLVGTTEAYSFGTVGDRLIAIEWRYLDNVKRPVTPRPDDDLERSNRLNAIGEGLVAMDHALGFFDFAGLRAARASLEVAFWSECGTG